MSRLAESVTGKWCGLCRRRFIKRGFSWWCAHCDAPCGQQTCMAPICVEMRTSKKPPPEVGP